MNGLGLTKLTWRYYDTMMYVIYLLLLQSADFVVIAIPSDKLSIDIFNPSLT